MADRLRIAIGSQAFYGIEGEFWTGSNHQKIIVEHPAITQLNLIAFRVEPLGASTIESDALAFQVGLHLEFNRLALAPVDGYPRVGRQEMEGTGIGYHRDVVPRTKQGF